MNEPGFIRKLTTKEMLSKYELGGVFKTQGLNSFFLINVEPIFYLFFTSVVTYLVIKVLAAGILKGRNPADLKESELGMIEKQIVKKSEGMSWNGFPNQFMVYTM